MFKQSVRKHVYYHYGVKIKFKKRLIGGWKQFVLIMCLNKLQSTLLIPVYIFPVKFCASLLNRLNPTI